MSGSAPLASRQRYTCGKPPRTPLPGWSATNQSSPPGVHTGSVTALRDVTSATATPGESAGQRTSAQWPAALRTPAIQRPSGEGTTASQVAPAVSGAGTVGTSAPGLSASAASRPPPPRGWARRAPRVTRRHPLPGRQRYRSLRTRQREV